VVWHPLVVCVSTRGDELELALPLGAVELLEPLRPDTVALPCRDGGFPFLPVALATRVTCPGPGPRINVSLALFHLHASRGTYKCVLR